MNVMFLLVLGLLLQNQSAQSYLAEVKVDHSSQAIQRTRSAIEFDLFESILRDGEQGARRTLR